MPLQNLLTPRRVHLLGGVSDAGKTRFVIPAVANWTGAPSWVYVVGDRTLEDAQDTMNDMGINPQSIVTVPAFGQHNKSSLMEIMCAVENQAPQAELIVIEGFQDFCPGTGTKRDVREYLSNAHAYLGKTRAHPNGLTILGVVESPKLKPTERYSDPRQRISGPAGWGYHASTVMLIEPADKNDSMAVPERIMWICHKGVQRRKVDGTFDALNRLVFPSL